MSAPVNLNKYRKARAKADKASRAQENAVKFGRTGAEKKLDRDLARKASRDLDNHQLRPDDPEKSAATQPEPDA